MMDFFIEEIKINKVRHLENVNIPICKGTRKHLILTGRNGSGKTSVLEKIKQFISHTISNRFLESYNLRETNEIFGDSNELVIYANGKLGELHLLNKGMKFICTYIDVRRTAKSFEKVDSISHPKNPLPSEIVEDPAKSFLKYITNLDYQRNGALTDNNTSEYSRLQGWFDNFEKALQNIYNDPNLKLKINRRELMPEIELGSGFKFPINCVSDGYGSFLYIMMDIMMRIDDGNSFNYDKQGIVLIDEIENHLHLELQSKIMPFLTGMFPNIQFIVSTHSPAVLIEAKNCTVFDLENRTLVTDDELSNITYGGVVRSYFGADTLSSELRSKFERYKELFEKNKNGLLETSDYAELAEIESYLDEVPDYLALDFSAEYQRLKLEFEETEWEND